MFTSINFDKVAEHVKNIYDSTRCSICDKHDGKRMRYSCGHTSCDECVDLCDSCVLCLTPPETTSRKPVIDDTLTRRSKHAINLVNIFRDKFNIDVNKRQRISEQLKLEKELFPQCIQAPAKYFNKRKSIRVAVHDKENKQIFPGEEVSSYLEVQKKMENSNNNVQQWINRYIRKPFSELNPNAHRFNQDNRFNKKQENLSNVTETTSFNRKRPHQIAKHKKVLTENNILPKRSKILDRADTNNDMTMTNNKINDESGIVLDGHDDDDVIVLDDSQSVTVDKDYNAWLAVQESETHISDDTNVKSIEECNIQVNSNKSIPKNQLIPFYKKGSLRELCKLCSNCDFNIKCNHSEEPKDFVITVENSSFLTVVKVSKTDTIKKQVTKNSTEVQTETIEKFINGDSGIENVTHKNGSEVLFSASEDIFKDGEIVTNSKQMALEGGNNKHDLIHNVIIEESDTDDECEHSLSLEVSAEVHRSCDQLDYGVLTNVNDIDEHSKRQRRAPRGLTPTSTDSSDKENYNPNRMKTKITSKKKYKK